ncbi:MAG: 6,7-dimethyl-8-ribityllumazine synthase [Ilumatobacteraceae bacterium]
MSREGSSSPAPVVDGSGLRVCLISARFNDRIVDALAEGARRGLERCGVSEVTEITVPGALEIPAACDAAARHHDAVIALGCVIRGETYHFEVVADASARGVMDAGLRNSTAITNAILTVENLAQAEARSGPGDDNKGFEAALGAIELARVLADLA